MTAYVLSGACNIDQLGTLSPSGSASARAGGDTVDTNGFKFTIDQDTRYGLTGGSTLSLGSLTINAAKGGDVEIDARAVRVIPYNTGTGNVPAYNTTISQGGVTGKLIRVQSAINATPTAVAAAMPATGFITVKQQSGGAYAAGALTGIGASATGADVAGWIELVGDEAATINCNRLGTLRIRGAWYEVGSTSGSSATTYQLPTNGSVQYYPTVYVDSAAVTVTGASWSGGSITYTCASHEFVVGDEVTITGASPSGYNKTDTRITAVTATTFTVAASDPGTWTSGGSAVVPEPYICAGSLVAASSTGTEAARGKVCWASTGGVLRFGSDGTNTVGYVPPSGRRIRIPNILTANCTTAARQTNALPNATIATRYDLTTTGGGVIDIDKAMLCWYPSVLQGYSVEMRYVGIAESLSLLEVAQAMTIVRCGVGQVAAQANVGLVIGLCFAGGQVNGCHWSRAVQSSAAYIATVTDASGFTFTRNVARTMVTKSNVGAGSWHAVRALNCTWADCTVIGSKPIMNGVANCTWSNLTFIDRPTGTTNTTAAENNSALEFATAASANVKLDGLTFGGLTNVQPYLALINVNVAGCTNIKIRNIGTYATPLTMGSANGVGTPILFGTGVACIGFEAKRVYVSNTRTNLWSADNSCKNINFVNVAGDYADAPVSAMLNCVMRAIGATHALSAQTACYGTHWIDYHTSTTAGRIAVLMNEPTSDTTDQVALTGGAAFTAAGGLYMPTVGMTATFTMPVYCIGHTGFQNSALVMAGGTAGNYTYAFQIDKNDGNGFSAWSSERTAAQLGTDLNALTGISAVNGFKLKLRITTGTGNTTAITSVYVLTTSTTTTQAYQYALDTITLTLTGLQTGSDVVVYSAGTTTVLGSADAVNSYAYVYSTPESVDIGVFKAGYVPFYIRAYALSSADASLPVAQVVDRAYLT